MCYIITYFSDGLDITLEKISVSNKQRNEANNKYVLIVWKDKLKNPANDNKNNIIDFCSSISLLFL